MSQFLKPVKKETLAEQMAEALKEAILSGEWQAGEALPTEPELAGQFGVSRAVVRDATRMLIAQGLVEAQHGRGVFVTDSPLEAFSQALLLALRRVEATVWDVEQFEQLLFPEACALAAAAATDEEIAALHQLVEENLQTVREILMVYWTVESPPAAERERLRATYRAIQQAIFAATHNRVLPLLAQPLLPLRNLRHWQGEITVEEALARETRYFQTIVNAIASRDSEQARTTVRRLMQLSPEAEAVMRQTPVGEIPVIPARAWWKA